MQSKFVYGISLFILTFLVALLTACINNGGGLGIFSRTLLITPSEVNMVEGTTLGIVVTAQKDGMAESDVVVTFKSESTNIATVNPNQCVTDKFGQCSIFVTTVSQGRANIVITADKYTSAIMPVTVSAASATKVFQTSQNPIIMRVGGGPASVTITALQTNIPQPNVPIEIVESQSGNFFSTTPLMCTTDSNGQCNFLVFGLSIGNGVLQVTAPNYVTLAIPVIATDRYLEVVPNPLTIESGESQVIQVTAFINDGIGTESGVTVNFTSNSTNASPTPSSCITNVSGTCNVNVKGNSVGSATITGVASGFVSGTTSVTVVTPVPRITLTPPIQFINGLGTMGSVVAKASTGGISESGVLVTFTSNSTAVTFPGLTTCTTAANGQCTSPQFQTVEFAPATITGAAPLYESGTAQVQVLP